MEKTERDAIRQDFEAMNKKEWVATLHGQNGTVRIAYRNPRALAVGLAEQTAQGWMVALVYERDREICVEQ